MTPYCHHKKSTTNDHGQNRSEYDTEYEARILVTSEAIKSSTCQIQLDPPFAMNCIPKLSKAQVPADSRPRISTPRQDQPRGSVGR